MRAFLKNYRQSPRKVRHVADLVRGKSVEDAKVELDNVTRKSGGSIKKLIDSAVANAKHLDNREEKDLYIKSLRVDKGIVMKRFRARAFGRAFPVRKRTSNIRVELGFKEEDKSVKK